MRTFRNHRGVKIFRIAEVVCGSDFDFCERTGRMVARRPEIEVHFRYAGGVLCDSVDECRADIDEALAAAAARDLPEAEMVATLNDPDA